MPKESKYIVKGQDDILEAIEEDNIVKLWKLVQHIGYKKIESDAERKLVFFRAYHDFDIEKCDNFVFFYNMCINNYYFGIVKRSCEIFTCNKRAREKYGNESLWPTSIRSSYINQSEHILDKFVF